MKRIEEENPIYDEVPYCNTPQKTNIFITLIKNK